ncbi:hypothetical protein ACFWWM_16890 [Streptomyces sp. NPDC058682]|nr:hypothetical protein [Streptomyces sp. NBC_01214]MCX4804424.1 hypothetical protein [Streptomyces sp. NBC_01214]
MLQHYRALLTAVRGEPARHGLDGSFSSTTVFPRSVWAEVMT